MFSVANFLLLSTFINNTLFVNFPKNTQDCYVAFSVDNPMVKTQWPNDWNPMDAAPGTFKIQVNASAIGSILHYKLKYILSADGGKTRTLFEINSLNSVITNLTNLSTTTGSGVASSNSTTFSTKIFIEFISLLIVGIILLTIYGFLYFLGYVFNKCKNM